MINKILFITLILLGFMSLKYLKLRKHYTIECERRECLQEEAMKLKQELDSLTIKLDTI